MFPEMDILAEKIHERLLPRFAAERGDERIYFCIFHQDENTPNLYVNKRKGVFRCWACNASGSIYTLAEKLGISVPHVSGEQKNVDEILHLIYNSAFPLTEEDVRHLCNLRRLSEATILEAGIRKLVNLPPSDIANGSELKAMVGRYIIPVKGTQDDLRLVIGYHAQQPKKYIYPPKVSLFPFGMNLTPTLSPSKVKEKHALYVVEGVFDALTAREWGDYGIALLGVSNYRLMKHLTHYSPLAYDIYLSPDFDKSGRQYLYYWAREALALGLYPSFCVVAPHNTLPVKDFNDIHRKIGKKISDLLSEGLLQKIPTTIFFIEETERRGQPLAPAIVFLMFSIGILDTLDALILVKKDIRDLAQRISDKIVFSVRQAKALSIPTLLSFLETNGVDIVIMLTAATTPKGKQIILEYFLQHEVAGLFNILPHVDIDVLPLGLDETRVRRAVKRIAAAYRRLCPNSFFYLSNYIINSILPTLDV